MKDLYPLMDKSLAVKLEIQCYAMNETQPG